MGGSWARRALLGLAGGVVLAIAVLALIESGAHHRVYRQFLYAVVAQRVAGGAVATEEAVLRVHDFVYLNVRTPSDAQPIDDSAADTLLRGVGYCDSVTLAFIRLLHELGVPARMVFLHAADGSSPHTLAEVLLDGQWRVLDPLYNVVPRGPDGAIATAEDILREPSLLGESRTDPEWFRQRTVAAVNSDVARGPEGAVLPVIRLVAQTAPEWVLNGFQDAYLRLPAPTYHQGDFHEDFATPDARLFYEARNLHLFQRAGAAEQAYERLLASFPGSDYSDTAQYELGLLRLSQTRALAEAAESLEQLVTKSADSPWRQDALYLLARAHEERGECLSAAQLYREVALGESNGREDSLRRLEALRCADPRPVASS